MAGECRYTVETLRRGQPRAYADHENEYLITVERAGWEDGVLRPWVLHEGVERRIAKETQLRATGKMYGGQSPEQLRKEQRDWAKGLIMVLCERFREAGDDDGRTGLDAHFFPTLKSLSINHAKGQIRALIVTPYTD